MKIFILVLVCISLTTTAWSAGKLKAVSANSPDKTMSQLGTIDNDTLDMDPVDKKESHVEGKELLVETSKVKMSFSCKAKDGQELKQGEVGYDDCLQKVKSEKKNFNDPNAELKVKFGN